MILQCGVGVQTIEWVLSRPTCIPQLKVNRTPLSLLHTLHKSVCVQYNCLIVMTRMVQGADTVTLEKKAYLGSGVRTSTETFRKGRIQQRSMQKL